MPLNFVAKAAITAGLTLANMALTMTRKIEGPRLDDLTFSGGDYGASLPMIWGLRRMELPIFWAEPLREIKRRRKTKGGKFNEYTYYGTWAVAMAGHEIEGVSRIWFDTHLIYDLTGAGPVTPFDFGSNGTGGTISDYITIYTGTETQDPDPRMQATVEAEFGEGSCPAYRGTAYVIFKDIPLEKLGNRIPQVSVEVVSNAAPTYPFETFTINDTNLSRLWGATFSSDYTRFMWASNNYYEIWDVAARARMIAGPLPTTINFQSPLGLFNDGTFLAADGGEILRFSADGLSFSTLFDATPISIGRIRVLADGAGNEHWVALSTTDLQTEFVFDGVVYEFTDWFANSWPTWAFNDAEGSIWVCGGERGAASSTAHFLRVFTGSGATGPDTITVTGLYDGGGVAGVGKLVVATHFSDGTLDQFVFSFNDRLYTAERTTGTLLEENATDLLDPFNFYAQFAARVPGSSTLWLGPAELNLADITVVRTVNMSNWAVGSNADGVIYDPVNNALITSPTSTPQITWRYLDRISSGGVTLGQICSDVADDCGVQDYSFGNLNQVVTGWSATRGAGSSILEPLLDAYDSDIRPHDFTIEGIKRTGVTTGSTLLTERFVGEPRYSVRIQQSSELPRAIMIDFADIDADQQPNAVRSDRPLDATDARGEKKIDLTTLAIDADEARNLADRHFRRIWNERRGVSFGLTAQNLGIEPGDVRTLSLDGEEMIARCISMTVQADDVIATEWRYDSPSLALLNGGTGAAFDGREPSVVVVPLLSKGFVIDTGLLDDSDEMSFPQVYTLAAPYADGPWAGASIFEGVDGEFSDELATIPTSSAATWGFVSGVMLYANPNLWDRGTEITVTLQTGELTGCTEAAADAAPLLNFAAIGTEGRWELVQFTNATLVSGKTYTVSGFKRGRRGTEWAAELHAGGDAFVLLDTAEAQARGLSDIGQDLAFQAITAGRTSGFTTTFEYQGQTLKPYAPAHLSAVKEASGDWTISAIRRTRVGGSWRGLSTIPLGEASESYRVTVGDGVASVNKTVSSLPYTWTVADQTTDTGAEVMAGDLEYAIAQISAAVGAGFVSSATA